MENEIKKTSNMVNIASFTNKLVRASKLMLETEADYLIDKMIYIDENSDPYDIAIAFDKDLGATANIIRDIANVVSSLNQDHQAVELQSDEKDFRVLFPNNYDPETQSLTIFGVALSPDGGRFGRRTTLEIKEHLFDTIFSNAEVKHSFDDFRKLVSNLKKLGGLPIPTQETPFQEVLGYTGLQGQVSNWHGFYKKVLGSADKFHDYRESLSPRDKVILDEDIISVSAGRASVYGTVKTSTSIRKQDGYINQFSKSHNTKAPDGELVVDKIKTLLNDIPFLSGVEIDKSADPVKFHDMLVDMKYMGLDVPVAFELKARHLGNYKASGLAVVKIEGGFMVSEESGFANAKRRVVAFDFESGTGSVAHEIAHIRDITYDETRQKMVSHFTNKIDTGLIAKFTSPSQQSYFTNDREVIARLGEVGFLLNMSGYKMGEEIPDFIDRIKREGPADIQYASEKIGYDVTMVKGVDVYLGLDNDIYREIYFNFAEWSPEEAQIAMDYTHAFYYKHDVDVKNRLESMLKNGQLNVTSNAYQDKLNKRPRHKRLLSEDQKIGAAFGRLDPSDLPVIYKLGAEKGYFEDGEFVHQLQKHIQRPGKGGSAASETSSLKISVLNEQIKGLTDLVMEIDASKRPVDAIILRASLVKYIERAKLSPGSILTDDVKIEVEFITKMMAKMNVVSSVEWEDAEQIYSTLGNAGNRMKDANHVVFSITQNTNQLEQALNDLSTQINKLDLDFADIVPSQSIEHIPLLHILRNKMERQYEFFDEVELDFVMDTTLPEVLKKVAEIDSGLLSYPLIKNLQTSSIVAALTPVREAMSTMLKYEREIINEIKKNGIDIKGLFAEIKEISKTPHMNLDSWLGMSTVLPNYPSSHDAESSKLTTIAKVLLDSGMQKSDVKTALIKGMLESGSLDAPIKRIGVEFARAASQSGVGNQYGQKVMQQHPLFRVMKEAFISNESGLMKDDPYILSSAYSDFFAECMADDYLFLAENMTGQYIKHNDMLSRGRGAVGGLIGKNEGYYIKRDVYPPKLIDFLANYSKQRVANDYTIPTENLIYKRGFAEIESTGKEVKEIMQGLSAVDTDLARKVLQSAKFNIKGGFGYMDNDRNMRMSECEIEQTSEMLAATYIPEGLFFADAREIDFESPKQEMNVEELVIEPIKNQNVVIDKIDIEPTVGGNEVNYLTMPTFASAEQKDNCVRLTEEQNKVRKPKLKHVDPEIERMQPRLRF